MSKPEVVTVCKCDSNCHISILMSNGNTKTTGYNGNTVHQIVLRSISAEREYEWPNPVLIGVFHQGKSLVALMNDGSIWKIGSGSNISDIVLRPITKNYDGSLEVAGRANIDGTTYAIMSNSTKKSMGKSKEAHDVRYNDI